MSNWIPSVPGGMLSCVGCCAYTIFCLQTNLTVLSDLCVLRKRNFFVSSKEEESKLNLRNIRLLALSCFLPSLFYLQKRGRSIRVVVHQVYLVPDCCDWWKSTISGQGEKREVGLGVGGEEKSKPWKTPVRMTSSLVAGSMGVLCSWSSLVFGILSYIWWNYLVWKCMDSLCFKTWLWKAVLDCINWFIIQNTPILCSNLSFSAVHVLFSGHCSFLWV